VKNIKAFVIFLSWSMLFTHSIIPHKHAEESGGICIMMHSLAGHHDVCVTPAKFSCHCDHENSCSISNILFHKFGQEELSYLAVTDMRISHSLNTCKAFFATGQDTVPESFLCSIHLRAPPVA
jgi:hypothetical protein